jgi:hypothetical protein
MQKFAVALTEKTNPQMHASDYFPAEIGAGCPKRETPSQRAERLHVKLIADG